MATVPFLSYETDLHNPSFCSVLSTIKMKQTKNVAIPISLIPEV